MKRISMSLVGLLLMSGGLAWGNGGGYIRGGVGATGGIAGFEPVATEHVRILDETLLIRAGRQSAKVEVRYLMRNMTDKKVKVRFGFPIEETPDDSPYRPIGEREPQSHKSPQYCKNYEITARGRALRVRWQAEENPEGDRRFNGLSGWNVSEITFAKGEEVPVTIRVELNGEHRFDAAIPDREEEVVIPVRGYDKPVRKIHLTFTEVYPGEVHEDMCVTRVMLHARLDREPKMQPQR